jgi:hypothetical protein
MMNNICEFKLKPVVNLIAIISTFYKVANEKWGTQPFSTELIPVHTVVVSLLMPARRRVINYITL